MSGTVPNRQTQTSLYLFKKTSWSFFAVVGRTGELLVNSVLIFCLNESF